MSDDFISDLNKITRILTYADEQLNTLREKLMSEYTRVCNENLMLREQLAKTNDDWLTEKKELLAKIAKLEDELEQDELVNDDSTLDGGYD